MAAPRFLANVLGRIKMIATIATSAGAGDAEKVPSTNASGVLDPSILNAATTGNDKVVMTNSNGQLELSIMPTGIGPDTSSLTASEALAAGDIVNIWNDAGTAKARKADATAEGKEANGFVLSGVSLGATALVYHEGKITGLSSLTIGGRYYLSASTPGAITTTAPASAGNVSQYIGVAVNATTLNFEPDEPITVA